ncbi:uncharacterized protein [Chironomus tepperi]|uniref:uncharacterized protein n=1 Tax=Chironomus tepperi TaxID=113505 RepID=UPI00391F0E12
MDEFLSVKIEIPDNFDITLIEPQDDDYTPQFEVIESENLEQASTNDINENGIEVGPHAGLHNTKSAQQAGRKRRKISKTTKLENCDKSSTDPENYPNSVPEIGPKDCIADKNFKTMLEGQQVSQVYSNNIEATPVSNNPNNHSSTQDSIAPAKKQRRKRSLLNELQIHGRTSNYFTDIDQLPKERETRRKAMTTSKLMTNIFNQNEEFNGISEQSVRRSRDVNMRNYENYDKASRRSGILNNFSEFSPFLDSFAQTSANLASNSNENVQNSATNGQYFGKQMENWNENSQHLQSPSSKLHKVTSNIQHSSIKLEPISPQKSFTSPEKVTIKIDPIKYEESTVFECNICHRTFSSYSSIKQHKNMSHRKKITYFTQIKNAKKSVHTCPCCKTTVTYPVLKLHQKRINQFGNCRQKLCPICHEPLEKGHYQHMKERHLNVLESCKFCNLNFTKKSWENVKNHMMHNHAVQFKKWKMRLKYEEKQVLELRNRAEEPNDFHDVIVNNFNI